MTPKAILFVMTAAILGLSACSPLVVGAGAAVLADKVVENRRGGDGLF